MRIMEIISGKEINGAVRHCLLLSEELARRGHEVTLVCPPGSWISRQIGGAPIDVVGSDLHRYPTDELRRIAGVVQRRGIEVTHTHMSRAHFFGVLLRWFSGVPCVATAHNRLIQLHWMFNDLVIAVCEATRRYQQTHNLVRTDRITTIHNFIDDRPIQAVSPDARNRLRAALGLDDSCLAVGLVGHVCPRKGQIHLVQAMPEILAAQPAARFIVVGDRSIDAAYAARVDALALQLRVADRIQFTGTRGDVPELLSAFDLFVLCSLEESEPLTILEAMAAGLPVVATAVGGVPECVTPGVTGWLVPPANPRALARAVVALLSDAARRRVFGEAGRDRVHSRFSPRSQAAAVEQAFRSVVRRRAA